MEEELYHIRRGAHGNGDSFFNMHISRSRGYFPFQYLDWLITFNAYSWRSSTIVLEVAA